MFDKDNRWYNFNYLLFLPIVNVDTYAYICDNYDQPYWSIIKYMRKNSNFDERCEKSVL